VPESTKAGFCGFLSDTDPEPESIIGEKQEPVSSEISDLRNIWFHAMCACTEWYSACLIR